MSTDDQTEKFRIDKWLCAARFFKTRSLAADAVVCGKVQINEARVKPARTVAVGDMITINIGQKQYVVEVTGLSDRRGPAAQAQKLYLETDASRQRQGSDRRRTQVTAAPFLFQGQPDQARPARDRETQEGSNARADNPDLVRHRRWQRLYCCRQFHFDSSSIISRRMVSAKLGVKLFTFGKTSCGFKSKNIHLRCNL